MSHLFKKVTPFLIGVISVVGGSTILHNIALLKTVSLRLFFREIE